MARQFAINLLYEIGQPLGIDVVSGRFLFRLVKSRVDWDMFLVAAAESV